MPCYSRHSYTYVCCSSHLSALLYCLLAAWGGFIPQAVADAALK